MSEVGPSSPPGTAQSPLTVPSSRTPTPEPLNRIPERDFWVELRHATTEERNYGDFHLDLHEIVAEHTEGWNEFYYVLLGDNKHHKIKAEVVREEYPDLLNDFKRRKRNGLLEEFDPYGASVHPLSQPPPQESSASSGDEYISEDSEEEIDQLDPSESDVEEFVPVRQLRPRTRLPFSPAKVPQKRRIRRRTQSSDSDDEIIITRRSTRSKRNIKSYRDDDEYEVEEPNASDDALSLPKKKKRARTKASRPAYGHFREVADLELDDQSDDETLPLRAHRDECEKCRHPPSHILLKKLDRRRKNRRSRDSDEEDEEEDERDNLEGLGGWVRCLKCPVAMHWKCLNMEQRSEIRKAALERDMEEFERKFPLNPDGTRPEGARKPSRRAELGSYETTEFICTACMKGGSCIGCGAVALEPDPRLKSQENKNTDEDVAMEETQPRQELGTPKELFFRCITCKRLSHYEHLPPPDHSDGSEWDVVSLAKHYSADWLCGDCASFTYKLEKIIAWRPSPEGAAQPDDPNYRDALPREYLVKWKDRSYRRVTWVPHMWILATHGQMLRHFTLGTSQRVTLMERPVLEEVQDPEPTAPVGDSRDSAPPVTFGDVIEDAPLPSANEGPAEAMPDAHLRIPPAWKTVDRVLDILLWRPKKGSDDEAMEHQRKIAFESGEQPSDNYVSGLDSWERTKKRDMKEKDIHHVAYAFFKWNDLGYDDCSWDTPPRPGEFGFQSFQKAFKRFLNARTVWIPRRNKQQAKAFDDREEGSYPPIAKGTPSLGQSPDLKLMPFQVEGLKWLFNNWWNHQHCILADEMGLGKTIQIVTFIGLIIREKAAAPCLVVVPNSTVTSWVREFERWAPCLRVVPYHGEAKSREIVRRYELTHDEAETGFTKLKYHVLITTYETITNSRDFGSVFKQVPRWEALVVDEGQRLKNDSSLIFKKLTELRSIHRIIMTGTPLNNNIRELFNLLNFLDPDQWGDLKALEKQYEELTEELVKSLHTRLRPYFLRRIKTEVLQLPPKNEVIVPVSMTLLQKEIYRSILSQNLDVLKFLSQPTIGTRSGKNNITKTNLNNMLMQLRKCLQHPYIVNEGIEPKDLAPTEVHEKLVSASAKLVLLRMMLPKLKERGHRVLLFSQFKLVLDIVEDFLDGEGIKHLRLDGDTPGPLRQKGIDEFNKPDSDVFVYLLTTRAGGVGINLYTADTVIIFDPDFNPHQDLQAIARAHRYGQKKTCLVFKLMVKNSAEDRIMQVGKKKLALDHVIVQKMDDELGEDVQSILTFGAQQLFQDENTDRGITYSDADVQSLIEKTEKEGDQLEEAGQNQNSAFSFAKIWAADKDALTEMSDVTSEHTGEVDDSWAQVLAKLETERSKVRAQEVTGRGAKRKAAPSFLPEQNFNAVVGSDGSSAENSPEKPKKKKGKKKLLDREDYNASVHSSADETMSGTDASSVVPDEPLVNVVKKTKKRGLAHDQERKLDENYCGLCGTIHVETCYMVQNVDNLAEYRAMLMEVTNEEPIETRREAVQAIDETLLKMGKLDLIKDQPPYLADKSKKRKKPHESDQGENVTGDVEKVKKPRKPRKPRNITVTKVDLSQPWMTLNAGSLGNPLTSTISAVPTLPPVVDPTTIASSSKGPGSLLSTNPLRPPKKAKTSTFSTPSTGVGLCSLCGGLKHNLYDCPAPKGGIEKIDELYRKLSTRPGGVEDFHTLSWLKRERSRLQALAEAARAGGSRPQPPTNMGST